jgi:glycosyltransferase involved in cell wall biosynthesis
MAESRDVLLFSTADWDAAYWTNKQHTARHLAALGFRVLYVESPGLRTPTANARDIGRMLRRLKRGLTAGRKVESGIWVLSPLVIPFKHHLPLMRTINQGWLRRQVMGFMNRQGFSRPIVWTYHPFVLETVQGLDYSKLVYHNVDDLAAIPGVDAVAFRAEEERLLNRADAVFTTSEALRDKCAAINPHTHYMPNVTDVDHFGRARQPGNVPDDLAAIPEPRIGFVGVLSDFKVDFALVLEVVRTRPDWNWVFIGEEREGQASPLVKELRGRANAHFLGHKPYEILPEYLRGIAVGTLPNLINEYTRSMFPMKYYEYLAAGIPVVTTPLEFARRHGQGLEVGTNAQTFAQAIERQLARGRLTDAEALDFVGDNTWKHRTVKMLECIGVRT